MQLDLQSDFVNFSIADGRRWLHDEDVPAIHTRLCPQSSTHLPEEAQTVTRAAAREGVEYYLGRLVKYAYDAFDVSAALRGTSGSGGRLLGRLLKRSDTIESLVVEPELERYRSTAMTQFEAVLDYAASDAPPAEHRDALLADDQYLAAMDASLSAERRAEIESVLFERAVRVGDAVAPIVAADEDDFWPAVVAAYNESEARQAVTDAVSFTGPLRQFPAAFTFAVEIDPSEIIGRLAFRAPTFSVDYTEEAARCLGRAEDAVRDEVERDVTRRYGSAPVAPGGAG